MPTNDPAPTNPDSSTPDPWSLPDEDTEPQGDFLGYMVVSTIAALPARNGNPELPAIHTPITSVLRHLASAQRVHDETTAFRARFATEYSNRAVSITKVYALAPVSS